jgi:Zn-dependent protease with chaperone function
MQDIDKTRNEYVMSLEEQVRHLTRLLGEAKPMADKWTPIVATANEGNILRVTVGFGGKRVTVALPNAALINNDINWSTSTVTDAVMKNLVFDHLAAVIRPEIEAAQRAVASVASAGKW